MLRLVCNDGRFPHLVDVYGEQAKERLRVLQLLVAGDPATGRTFAIRIVPDSEFGFVHGKAGVMRYADGRATSFIGGANDTDRAWSQNYELVWEDDGGESIQWVQEEFDALWERGFPITEFIVKQIGRLGQRTIIEHVGDWKKNPEAGPVLGEVPPCTELFGFWDHQKYFIKKAFDDNPVSSWRNTSYNLTIVLRVEGRSPGRKRRNWEYLRLPKGKESVRLKPENRPSRLCCLGIQPGDEAAVE